MKKEYKIQQVPSGKYVIIYMINGEEETTEHYSMPDFMAEVEIREGYIKHEDSL